MILDNLSAHLNRRIRRWADRNKVELCFTPTYASWANPIEAHFGPLRQFTLANSNHPNHTVQTRALHAYLRWRNENARHPDVLAAQRRERARIRSEKHIRWGGRSLQLRPEPADTLGTASVVELKACRLRTGNKLANRAGARDHGLKGSLELREVTQAPERTEHAALAVEVEALSKIRPGELHKTFPEVPVRLVSGGNHRRISGQAAGIQRQRVLTIKVMQGDSHAAIFPPPAHRLPSPTARPRLTR